MQPAGGETEVSLLLKTAVGFVSTLVATLIGVYIGFRKDRKAAAKNSRKTAVSHLKSIKTELDSNSEILGQNYRLLREMQGGSLDVDHYSVSLLSTNAWESAQNGDVIEYLDSKSYTEIQSLYTQIDNLNEQIRRLRTELLHSTVGETDEIGPIELDEWTIEVAVWEDGEISQTGLGDLIKNKSNQINGSIPAIKSSIQQNIDDLNPEDQDTLEEGTQDRTLSGQDGFNYYPAIWLRRDTGRKE